MENARFVWKAYGAGEGKISVSEPLADNLIIDLDKDGQAVGIEVLLPTKIDEKLEKKIKEICLQHR